MEHTRLEKEYKGFTVCGSAEPVHNSHNRWFATARVFLTKPDNTCLEVDRFQNNLLAYQDEDLAKWFGFGLAEITVDECLPPAALYLRPMDIGWAVDILRRAAEECREREICKAKLYEALNFLEKLIEPKWLVRRYRRSLRGDRPEYWQKEELREILRPTTRGIQSACARVLLARMNDLGANYRENKAEIDKLRRQLAIVLQPVRL